MNGRVIVLQGRAEALPLADASVDAVVCDPPYGLEFMGREWDTFRTGDGFRRSRNEADAGRDDPFGRASRTSPEYIAGSPFQAWCETWARECLRVLKPGGHLLAFGGTRTWHRLACAIEDAGFEIRDSVADLTGIDGPGLLWLYGSGFPKSLDVSKAIDRRRDDRAHILRVTSWLADIAEKAGVTRGQVDAHMGTSDMGGWWLSRLERRCAIPTWEQWGKLRELLGFGDEMDAEVWRLNGRKGEPGEAWSEREVVATGHRVRRESTVQIAGLSDGAYDITAPATDDAARWEGWGTALKPSWEPVVVGRKPLAGTVAANVLEHGTGALNIDGCRVGNSRDVPASLSTRPSDGRIFGKLKGGQPGDLNPDVGRWPPNVLLGEEAAAEMDRQSGTLTSGANPARRSSDKFRDAYGDFAGQAECVVHRGADSGGASRFFPVFRYEAKAGTVERPRLPDGTAWPTVKPVPLIRWLLRLVTPPAGTVLDLFCGTGTLGEAALIEGFNAILIDKDPQAIALTRVRMARPVQPLMFAEPEPAPRARNLPKPAPVTEAHPSLFDLEAS